MGFCPRCSNSGVIETGNNDLPCSCSAGDRALFNVTGVRDVVRGDQVKEHLLNDSPQKIHLKGDGQEQQIPASLLPGRKE